MLALPEENCRAKQGGERKKRGWRRGKKKRKAEQQPSVLFLAYGSRVWEIGGNGVELARNIYAAERARKCRVSFNERRDATKRMQETEKSKGRGEGEMAFSFNTKETQRKFGVKFNVSFLNVYTRCRGN